MQKNRFFALVAAASLVGFAACNGDDAEVETGMEVTDTTMITETETELAPVVTPVETTDTGLVETTVETEVEVDTIVRP